MVLKMRHVTGTIHHLHHVRISNVFLLDGGAGNRWIVDTGHFAERLTLLLELRKAGVRPGDLTGVLLTHRHSDHAGNAAFLRRRYGVKVYAHRADAQVLAGTTIRRGLAMPYPGYATDLVRARESIRAFCEKGVAYEHLLAGHGPPLVGGARERVLEMVAHDATVP